MSFFNAFYIILLILISLSLYQNCANHEGGEPLSIFEIEGEHYIKSDQRTEQARQESKRPSNETVDESYVERDVAVEGGLDIASNTEVIGEHSGEVELESQVLRIIDKYCSSCHHSDPGRRLSSYNSPPGNFRSNFITDIEELVTFGSPESSPLINLITLDSSTNKAAMPPFSPYVSSNELEDIRDWIIGEKSTRVDFPTESLVKNAGKLNKHISYGSILNDISDYLSKNAQNKKIIRFVTIAHLSNSQLYSLEELNIFRAGVAKGLYSLSKLPNISKLQAIDDQKTTYAIHLDQLGWSSSLWEDLHEGYPYEGHPKQASTVVIKQIQEQLNTSFFLTHAEWLIRKITHAGYYGKILGFPDNIKKFEDHLFAGVKSHKGVHGKLRAGLPSRHSTQIVEKFKTPPSQISPSSRIVERVSLNSPKYYYWKSYDFNVTNNSKYIVPLSPFDSKILDEEGVLKSETLSRPFLEDGGEMIFSLPNGLQAYFITDSKGNLITHAPYDIVNWGHSSVDKSSLIPPNMRIFKNQAKAFITNEIEIKSGSVYNGLSCISCHSRGLRNFTDIVADFYDETKNSYYQYFKLSETEKKLLRKVYIPQKIQKMYVADSLIFRDAIVKTYGSVGLSEVLGDLWEKLTVKISIEPVSFLIKSALYDERKVKNFESFERYFVSYAWLKTGDLSDSTIKSIQKSVKSMDVGPEPEVGSFPCIFNSLKNSLEWKSRVLNICK